MEIALGIIIEMKNKGLSYLLRLQVGFLWLLYMVLCSQLHAQEHLTRNMLMLSNLNTDNGISSARVYSIVEAEDGAIGSVPSEALIGTMVNRYGTIPWQRICSLVMPVAETSS